MTTTTKHTIGSLFPMTSPRNLLLRDRAGRFFMCCACMAEMTSREAALRHEKGHGDVRKEVR